MLSPERGIPQDAPPDDMFRPATQPNAQHTIHTLQEELAETNRGLVALSLELAQAEERYRGIFEHAMEGIFQMRPNGRLHLANPAMARIFGYASAQEFISQVAESWPHLYVMPTCHNEFMSQVMAQGVVAGFEAQVRRRDRHAIWITVNARTVCDPDGAVLYVEGSVEDITARKQAEMDLWRLSFHDFVTELPNRRLFEDRLAFALTHAKRRQAPLAILFLDLDNFKHVNDSLGHLAGDQLLRGVATRLRETLRECDMVARLGGDEFAILVPSLSCPEDVGIIAHKLIVSLQQSFIINSQEVFTSASVGVSLYPADGEEVEPLLRNADTALYEAKAEGKGTHRFFSDRLRELAVHRLTLEQDMRHALEREEFIVYYQPQIDLQTGHIVGMEALVRWERPSYGLVSPAEFLPCAEETGLIKDLGAWVLRTACKQAQRWNQLGYAPLRVAVNLSSLQFRDAGFIERVKQVLEKTGLPADLLELELTESVAMLGVKDATAKLRCLSALGIRLALDDFGTGYSSLNLLKHMPFTHIKIDKSFIDGILGDPRDAAVVNAIIAMADSLHLAVTAEGVESSAQVDACRAYQCRFIQGYVFSRAVSAEQFERLLAEKKRLSA